MPPQPRSGPASSPAGPSSSSQAASNRGLQLPRGRGVAIIRHIPFDLAEGVSCDLVGCYSIANRMLYRSEPAVNPTRILSMRRANTMRLRVCSVSVRSPITTKVRSSGVGLADSTSTFRKSIPFQWPSIRTLIGSQSCIVHPTLGSGGTQCGRCVGLGKGGECAPVRYYLVLIRQRITNYTQATRRRSEDCSCCCRHRCSLQ